MLAAARIHVRSQDGYITLKGFADTVEDCQPLRGGPSTRAMTKEVVAA